MPADADDKQDDELVQSLQLLVDWLDKQHSPFSQEQPAPMWSKSPVSQKHDTATNSTSPVASRKEEPTRYVSRLEKLVQRAKTKLEALQVSLQDTLKTGGEVGDIESVLLPASGKKFLSQVAQAHQQYLEAHPDLSVKTAKFLQHHDPLKEQTLIASSRVRCYYDLSYMRCRVSQLFETPSTEPVKQKGLDVVERRLKQAWKDLQGVKEVAEKHGQGQVIPQLEEELKALATDVKEKVRTYNEGLEGNLKRTSLKFNVGMDTIE